MTPDEYNQMMFDNVKRSREEARTRVAELEADVERLEADVSALEAGISSQDEVLTAKYNAQLARADAAETERDEERTRAEIMWRAGYGEAIRREVAGEDLDEQRAWESTRFSREEEL